MMIALRAKLYQYPELKQLLMSTPGNILVVHTENDNYWGDGGDGSGYNMLGTLLVELRENYLQCREGLARGKKDGINNIPTPQYIWML